MEQIFNEKEAWDQPLFQRAVSRGELDKAKLLLKYGADINEKDKYGNTALHFASMGKDIGTIEFLLKNWANINEKNDNGFTPYYMATIAIMKDDIDIEVAKYLIEKGADKVLPPNGESIMLEEPVGMDATSPELASKIFHGEVNGEA